MMIRTVCLKSALGMCAVVLLATGCDVAEHDPLAEQQSAIAVVPPDPRCRCENVHGICYTDQGDRECSDVCAAFGDGMNSRVAEDTELGAACESVFRWCRCGSDDGDQCWTERNGSAASCDALCDLYSPELGGGVSTTDDPALVNGASCTSTFGPPATCQAEYEHCKADCQSASDPLGCVQACIPRYANCLTPNVVVDAVAGDSSALTCSQLVTQTRERVAFCQQNCLPEPPRDDVYWTPCRNNATQIDANRLQLHRVCADRTSIPNNPCEEQVDFSFSPVDGIEHDIRLFLDVFRDAHLTGGAAVSFGNGTITTTIQQTANVVCKLFEPVGAPWNYNADTGRIEPAPGTTPQSSYLVELVCVVDVLYVARSITVDGSVSLVVTVGAGSTTGVGVGQGVPPAYQKEFYHTISVAAATGGAEGINPSAAPHLDPTFIPSLQSQLDSMIEKAATGVSAEFRLLAPSTDEATEDFPPDAPWMYGSF